MTPEGLIEAFVNALVLEGMDSREATVLLRRTPMVIGRRPGPADLENAGVHAEFFVGGRRVFVWIADLELRDAKFDMWEVYAKDAARKIAGEAAAIREGERMMTDSAQELLEAMRRLYKKLLETAELPPRRFQWRMRPDQVDAIYDFMGLAAAAGPRTSQYGMNGFPIFEDPHHRGAPLLEPIEEHQP